MGSYERHTPSRAEIVVGMAGDAIRHWLDRRELAGFMQDFPDAADRLARDLNTDKATLLDVAGRGSEQPVLLGRRLKALGIDADKLRRAEPAVAQDLARCCTLCNCKSRCVRDLDRDPDKQDWQAYCPNTYTLMALVPRPAASMPSYV